MAYCRKLNLQLKVGWLGGLKEMISALETMKTIAFLYHEVTDLPAQSGFTRPTAAPYKHSIAEFRDNLEAIATAGIGVSLVTDAHSSGDRILLTFDDGGRSALTIADHIEKRGWRGHFLVTTCMIGTRTFLSRDNIRELAGRGHIVGSHSHSHPNVFRALSAEQMADEWKDSIARLEDIIGSSVIVASIPGGDRDVLTDRVAGECGIRHLFTSEPVVRPWQEGQTTCYGRISIVAGTPIDQVRRFSHGEGLLKAQAVRFAKNTVKRILGKFYIRRMQELPTR